MHGEDGFFLRQERHMRLHPVIYFWILCREYNNRALRKNNSLILLKDFGFIIYIIGIQDNPLLKWRTSLPSLIINFVRNFVHSTV